jgi:hypothetical protein
MAVPCLEEVIRLELDKSLSAICSWVGMDAECEGRWATLLGFPGGVVGEMHPRVLAALPVAIYTKCVDDWATGDPPVAASLFNKGLAFSVYQTAVFVLTPTPAPGMWTAAAAGQVAEPSLGKKDAARKIQPCLVGIKVCSLPRGETWGGTFLLGFALSLFWPRGGARSA